MAPTLPELLINYDNLSKVITSYVKFGGSVVNFSRPSTVDSFARLVLISAAS